MKEPKPRIKRVFEKTLENLGKPIGEIMREEGYADSVADNPQNVTESKSWEMLLEDIPDKKLIQVLSDGLEANRVISAVNTGKQASGATADFIDVPDFMVRHKYLETGLKVKGRLVDRTDWTSKGEKLDLNVSAMLDKAYGTAK